MKNKPQKHKTLNTFKYKTFAEHVNEIDIRKTALYYIGHENEEIPEENETHFSQAIRKWTVLNLTEEYSEVCKEFRGIVTLPQLLHKKDVVVNYLLGRISKASPLSLQPLLEIVVAAARDLQDEFYPYLPRVLDSLINLLDTQDSEQLEWTLVCLAFLFKTLKPFLKRNIDVVLKSVLPVLDDRYPETTVNFAVQCFAFVARDIKDYDKLLAFIAEHINDYGETGILGMGRLFFEIIRGVNGNFHSVTEKFLTITLEALLQENYVESKVFDVLQEMVESILQLTHPHNAGVFWQVICKTTKKCLSEFNEKAALKLIALMYKAAEWKEGKFLSDLEPITETIIHILDNTESKEILLEISHFMCTILLSSHAKVSQLDTSRLINRILKVSSRDVFESFILSICNHSQFEVLILPELVKYFECYCDEKCTNLLAQIILQKSPLAGNGISLSDWKPYPIKLRKPATYSKILSNLDTLQIAPHMDEDFEHTMLTMIIFPHLADLEDEIILTKLEGYFVNMFGALSITSTKEQQTKVLFYILLMVECLLRLSTSPKQSLYSEVLSVVLPLCREDNSKISLRIVDIIFGFAKDNNPELLSVATYEQVHHQLGSLLSSPSHDVRRMVSHILNCFSVNSELQCAQIPIYDVFFQIESITPSVHTHRDQLLYLQKLSTENEFFKKISTSEELTSDCLRFLLGLLHHNFKLLWESTVKVIEGYASKMDVHKFWDVFKIKLIEIADLINGNQIDLFAETPTLNIGNETLQSIFSQFSSDLGKCDYTNYRNLLWSCISNAGKLGEVKNREIVTIFLKFVNEEYRKSHENHTLTWNLMANEKLLENLEDIEDEEQEEVLEKKIPKRKVRKDQGSKNTVSTLLIKLETFTKLVNPTQIYREKELYEFYLELLSNSNVQLQKMALDCLMAYKKKSLVPYKDHLYSFVDEKKFKDSLINLKIDKESDSIQLEHRKDFLEILLRILYGRMFAKTSNKNLTRQVRKNLVIRFLSGCDKTEIFLFLQLAFGTYENYLSIGLDEIPDKVSSDFHLDAVWSPKKMQSSINMLEMIRKNFGGLMGDEFLQYILKLIVFVGSATENVISNAETVHPKILTMFKNLKSQCLLSLVNFFDHFQNFKWSEKDMITIFNVFVWPTLNKLVFESIHSPTPLLKLFVVWSQNTQHFGFFGFESPFEQGLTPISATIDLLLNPKSKPIIRSTIMEVIERLLTMKSSEGIESSEIISGVSIVKPHISKILEKFHKILKQRGVRRGLDKRELNILSQLTNFVEDPDSCESLLEILLPMFVTKTRTSSSEDIIAQVIETISNLLKKVAEPAKHLRSIAPLFEQILEVSGRKMLCKLLLDVAKKSGRTKLVESAKIVGQLNAWDKRWVEQPDYDKRLSAISNLKDKLANGEVDIDLGLLVVYNCFYFIKHDKDMGLRDNASEFLRLLIPTLADQNKRYSKDINYFIGDVILNIVRRSLRDKNDTVRNECVQLFGELVRECPFASPILQDLTLLGDKNDGEVDFFANMTHLQSHRHGRALLKFCSVAKSLEKPPSPRTLTQFILPLATRYLLNEKFSGKHAVVDAAIETIGVVCRLLPWHQYFTILKYYLNKLKYNYEYQKQLVRIVVAILDAFHFDLTNVEPDSNAEKHLVVIKRIENEDKTQHNTKETDDNDNLDTDNEEESSKLNDDDLDSELDELDGMEDASKKEDEIKCVLKIESTSIQPVFDRITKLSPSNAKTVSQIITRTLLPTLNNTITRTSSYDAKHKSNRRKRDADREDEEILRVPIALAIVKLLQKLTKDVLDNSLPGVFMKVCTFLKSPLKSVRMCTRDILKKIMLTLGSEYLAVLVEKLTALLTRGFQVHVLSVTIHGVLDCLKELFKPGDLESCLQNILEVTLNDIFGDAAAEKEVEKIGVHTPEAKPSAKSYLTLHIIARNIQETCLLDLLMPFKEHLAKSQSRKIVAKIQDCFQRIVGGLVENRNISQQTLLIFIYGILSESITDLLPGKEKPVLTETEKERMRRARPDCYIIPAEPRSRSGAIRKTVKTNNQANAHVLIELGLELFNLVLKRKKVYDDSYEPFLNPLVPLLSDSLKSSHIRVTTLSLKCLTALWNGGYDLEAVRGAMDQIAPQIFVILHKYTSFGITKKNDNFHLVKNAFKAVVAILRKCPYYTIDDDHLAQLILYIEQDIQESDKQPMAFSLLKALAHRKVQSPEIHDIMRKMCDLSILSESNYAREEAREILIFYLMEYTLQKKVDAILKFFVAQLNYSVDTGRLSAIKFLNAVIKKFPEVVLEKKSEFLFLSLGTRLVNEEVPECRMATAECIEELISRLDDNHKQKLFDINLLFFNAEKPSVREMAAALCARFVQQEKSGFNSRSKIVLPVLVDKMIVSNPKRPGRFVRVQHDNSNEELDEENSELEENLKQRAIDHEIIQIQNCILKIFEYCPETVEQTDLLSTIDELAYESQRLLAYEHEWVRLNAAKIVEKILATYDFDALSRNLLYGQTIENLGREYIYMDPEVDIKSLSLDLCAQLIPESTSEQMAEQVVKVLLYIANILKDVQPEYPVIKKEEDDNNTAGQKINIFWLLRRIRYVVHGEVAKASHSCTLRTAIFNWIEGLIALMDADSFEKVSQSVLTILVREMSEEDQNIDPKLRQHAIRLGHKIRKKIGDDVYNKIRSLIQTNLMMKRADRKKLLAQEKVNDPVRAAKRKHDMQERKKVAKKKRVDILRGKIAGKKRKRKMDDDDLIS